MEISTVTSRGQVVIPQSIRQHYHIAKGTRLCFMEQGKDLVVRAVTDEYLKGLKGSLKTKGRALKTLLDERRRDRQAGS